MNSSGIKRGLATVAISALAVTGVPALANAATLATQEGVALQVTIRSVEDGGTASVASDGTNNTISLVATGGSAVEYVTFQRDGANIPGSTVARSANGDFQFEWTPGVGIALGNISAVRTDAAGAPAAGNVAGSSDTATGVIISGTTATVEIAPKASLGYFPQPAGGDYAGANSGGNVAGLSGTTSQGAGTLTVDADSQGAVAGASPITTSALPAGASSQSWNGVVNVTPAALAGAPADPDQFLPVIETGSNTRDAQGFNLYAQSIGSINVTAAPVLPDSTTTTVTVTVNDTTGQPVAGAFVARDNANGGTPSNGGFTNGLGQVTFTGATAGTQSYYVETTTTQGFNVGQDFRGSVTTTSSRPTTITFESKDGPAFDVDEFNADDVRIRVVDAGGNPLPGQRFFYKWTFAPFVTTTDTTQTSGEVQILTDGNGYASIAFPTAANFPVPAQASTLDTTGGSLTLNGYVNRDGSNPGQDPVDLALAASTIKRGESALTFDGPAATDRQSGTTQTFSGKLALVDGTVLGGRNLTLDYTRTGDSALSTTQPAGTTRLSATTGTAITSATGTFSVAITDPSATPVQVDELNNQLTATGVATVPGSNPVRDGVDTDATDTVEVDFRADAAAAQIEVVSTTNLIDAVATPGRPVAVQIRLRNNNSVPLAGQTVTLKTSNGFFTPNAGAPTQNDPATGLTADPAPAAGGLYGEWASLTDTITVTTDANGLATATVAIERDAGFDDDGLVRANITATSGGATNGSPISVVFNTLDEVLNPASVEVTPDEDQEADLPDARVGQVVDFDVFAKDQFGNLVEDTVVVSDNTNDASFFGQAGNGTVSLDSQFTSDSPAVTAFGEDDTAQIVSATWTQAANTYRDGDNVQPGFQPARNTVANNAVTDSADAINWYVIDFENSTFTLTSNPEGDVPVGTAVTETVKVLDQLGKPVDDLDVEFIRQGPGEQDGDPNVTRETNVNGEAFYSFTGTEAGTARISAVVTDGVQNETLTDTVVFVDSTTPPPPTGRIEINAVLTGLDNGAANDRLKVTTKRKLAAGATVRLFKKVRGVKVLVKTKKLNEFGAARFIAIDRNGRDRTDYFAIVSRTAETKADRTNNKTIR